MHKSKTIVAVAAVMLACVSGVQADVAMDWVTVGDPGNDGDVQSQGTFGGVSETYNIGTYEVTAGQYTEFLNAVAANDIYNLYHADMRSSPYGCQIERIGSWPNFRYSVVGAVRQLAPQRPTDGRPGSEHHGGRIVLPQRGDVVGATHDDRA